MLVAQTAEVFFLESSYHVCGTKPPSPQRERSGSILDSYLETGSGKIPSMEQSGHELKGETIIVVLGASGDLAKKKTFPALFGLYKEGYLPEDLHIIGYARSKLNEEEFKERQIGHIKGPKDDASAEEKSEHEAKLKKFQEISSYISGAYDNDEGFQALTKAMEEIESKRQNQGSGPNRIFYMALPPSVFTVVATNLKKNCYKGAKDARIVIEKPFGKDLESCREMMSALKSQWSEDETYRIDHYLGKEMIKNLLLLRFGNLWIESSWNKNFISNVQITFKEPFGTEGRGGYFDEFGIIRDVCQNRESLVTGKNAHLGSWLIVKVLRCIPAIERKDTLLGQYVAANGKPGYLDDETVPKGSVCPTFAALTLFINNPRWEGVPFIMKAGKALNEAKVEVRVQYKDVTPGIFSDIPRNELVLRIQPDEAIYMKMNAKTPGLLTRAIPIELDLSYKRRFDRAKIPEAYESLILDAFKGDHSNFVRDDELDVAWEIFTPILHWIDGKDGEPPKPESYPYGSRGPAKLDEFINQYGFKRSNNG
ncbi:hypothetical protein QFC19_001668 [Naganishia cerealis]|uniref:Uncharacterized protein n=1 Tax=Naganishia cerealis TaxID=610337 RepID=A0ACC2WGI4_9TREE|nr:hypothetical protein QFC19_001668 [Naganishia cerealis]